MRLPFHLLLLLLTGSRLATAQPLTPPNTIGNDFMYEAEDGAIWISSLSGWYRSYGADFELMGPHKDANGGFDPYVQSTLYPDGKGKLWYTGYTGLYRVDPTDESAEAYSMRFPGADINNDSYHLFHLDRRREEIWLKVNNRLGVYSPQEDDFQLISPEVQSLRFNVDTLADGSVSAIIGCIWYQGYGIEYLTPPEKDGELWAYQHFTFADRFPETRFLSATWLNDTEVLLASDSAGLFLFNPQSGSINPLSDILDQALPTGRTLRFADDFQHQRLLFSESRIGVWALHYGLGKRAKDLKAEFLYPADIDFFHYSSSGHFWGSIVPKEGEEISPGTLPIPAVSVKTVSQPKGLPGWWAALGAGDRRQLLLGGDNTLHIKAGDSSWKYQYQLPFPGEALGLALGGGAAYLLYRDSVFRFPLADSTQYDAVATGADGNPIFTVHENGDFLTAGNSGLRLWRKDTDDIYRYTFPPGFDHPEDFRHKVDYLNYLGNDQLALVENTPRLDIYEWVNGRLKRQRSFEIGQDITTVERVASGQNAWWVGTTAGLYLQTEEQLFLIEELRPGRERVSVQSISPIDSASVFIGTTNGLVYYNHVTKFSRTLGVPDGLPGNYFREGMAIRTAENEHWFITNGGAFGIHPQDVLDYSVKAPKAMIRAYWVSGLQQDIPLRGRKLDYRKNSIAFRLENNTFDYPALTKVKVRIPSIDEDWNWVENGGTIIYSDLKGGDYVLEVQGISKNGSAGDVRTYAFSVDFPFYRQAWFPWAVAAACLLVYLIVQLVKNKRLRAHIKEQSRQYEEAQKERKIAQQAKELREKELEKEREVKAVREHIHKDVHDSICGEFGSIHTIISRYQEDLKSGAPEASIDLTQIDFHSLLGMDEANEMIHVYNSEELIQQSPIKRLVNVIKYRCKSYELRSKITLDPNLPELSYPVINIRHMAMILKEGMENIRKYAQNASLVELNITQEAGMLSIYLKDNGVGIGKGGQPKNIYSRGNGMRNMQKRAQAISGNVKVSLRPEGGTCLHLSTPLKTID